jgi:hypothetical protein
MSNQLQTITIPPVETVDELRNHLQVILNRMAVAQGSSKLLSPIDGNGNRINRLADPVAPGDAVNLQTLKRHLAALKNAVTASANTSTVVTTLGPGIGYNVPIVAGIATPDASRPLNILYMSSAAMGGSPPYITLATPLNYSKVPGNYTSWSLTVQQDGVGGNSLQFSPDYGVTLTIASVNSPPVTQSHVDMRTAYDGKTFPISGLIDQQIP